jgi:single-stranded DNA-specific DHH superfamily exonuclease
MDNIAVPASQWLKFCEDFTRQHHGWLVGLHQMDTKTLEEDAHSKSLEIPMLSGHHPLQEVREGNTNDLSEVMVTVGEGVDEASFLIEDVIALYQQQEGKAHQGLRIDSGNGKSTVIEFRTAADPAVLDGLTDSE